MLTLIKLKKKNTLTNLWCDVTNDVFPAQASCLSYRLSCVSNLMSSFHLKNTEERNDDSFIEKVKYLQLLKKYKLHNCEQLITSASFMQGQVLFMLKVVPYIPPSNLLLRFCICI